MDPDALEDAQRLFAAAVHAYYDTAATAAAAAVTATPEAAARAAAPSFVVACPQNGAELVATRAAIAFAAQAPRSDSTNAKKEKGQSGEALRGAVVLLNPRFPLAPREMADFQCAFGLAPFRVQVGGKRPTATRLQPRGGL